VQRNYVAPISFGLGDLVVSLPAIQGLIAQARAIDAETWLVTRSDVQARLADRVAGLAGWVDDACFDRNACDGRFFDLRDHPLQRDWWWGSPAFQEEFGTLTINDILERICTDLGVPADFTRPERLTACPRPEVAGSVLLVIETDGAPKQWSVGHWQSLADALRTRGLDPRVVTREVAPSIGDAVDMLSAARAVVGIDTGLTHVAVQQGTPTVTICRPPAIYFRSWPQTRAVIGDRCDDACIAAEQAYAYNSRVDLRGFEWQPRPCPVDGRCLTAVQPSAVLKALESML
jgi:hypothetical protein